jgi:hypothetical protein
VSIVRDDRRVFAPTDRFEALVASARAGADELGRAEGEGCLLGPAGSRAYALRGDLALGLRPLPEPARSVDAALGASPRSAGLITLFGFFGEGPLLVAPFTPLPPPGEEGAVVMVLTPEGASLRSTGSVEPLTPADGLAPSAAARAAGAMVARGASPIVVAAEAEVPIEALAAQLAALAPLGAPVALGVPLEPGTRAPRALSPSEPPEAPSCAPWAPSRGAPPAAELRAALAPLGEAVRACRAASTSAAAARATALRLRMTTGEDGRVRDVCVAAGRLDDPGLRRCIEAAARRLGMPASGAPYTLELPLRLARDPSFDRAPYCAGEHDHPTG